MNGPFYSDFIRKKYGLTPEISEETKRLNTHNELCRIIENKAASKITRFSIHFASPFKNYNLSVNVIKLPADTKKIVVNYLHQERFYYQEWANHIVVDLVEPFNEGEICTQ